MHPIIRIIRRYYEEKFGKRITRRKMASLLFLALYVRGSRITKPRVRLNFRILDGLDLDDKTNDKPRPSGWGKVFLILLHTTFVV